MPKTQKKKLKSMEEIFCIIKVAKADNIDSKLPKTWKSGKFTEALSPFREFAKLDGMGRGGHGD